MGSIDTKLRAPLHAPEAFYQQLLDHDTRPVPDILRVKSPLQGGPVEVPVENYTSKAYHDLEVEKLWKRVWQMACREEEIPNIGDTMIYEIAHLKYIIVRVAADRIKAYPNACLHRGRQLVDADCRKEELRCPYHAWTWKLDGTVKKIPMAWDFPQVNNPEEWRLPEICVGTWGGFVFINPDPKAEPLKDFLGDIDRFYARYPLEKRYIAGHAAKVVPTNWKSAQEAFMEGWHVVGTHPQLLATSVNTDLQVDVFGNFARAIQGGMTPSALLDWTPTEQDMINAVLDIRSDSAPPAITVPEGKTARQQLAHVSREALRKVVGDEADQFCDAEMVDSFYYNIFPNIHPWAAFSRIFFRFRPYGDDPDRAIQDVYVLAPFSGERPPAAKVHWLNDDEDWTKAPEIGDFLARIVNQDLFNMKPGQDGMKTTHRKTLTFSRYMEAKIRHFHLLLARQLNRS